MIVALRPGLFLADGGVRTKKKSWNRRPAAGAKAEEIMHIIVVGCGKVGRTLAERLSGEGHDLVIVDLNAGLIQEVTEELDVMGVVGNGTSINVLMEAGIDATDLLIAVTASDELNLLCCLIGKKASKGGCMTIARVRDPLYNKEIGFIKEQMGISMVINPELTASMEIARLLRFPSAIKIDTFAKGRAELLTIKLRSSFGLGGQSVEQVVSGLRSKVLICAVERGNKIFIPNGSFVLEDGDNISLMATPQEAAAFFKKIGLGTRRVNNTLIVGGGTIAVYLARQLLDMGIDVHIIEINRERCQKLCEILPKATILHGDGSDQQLLMDAGLATAESFVAITNMDEENLLLSLFAKQHSNAKLVVKVNRIAFDDVIESLDLGSVIYPKYLTADYIAQYVRAAQNSIGSNVETLYNILDGRAEALEFFVRTESEVTGHTLSELDLKDNLLIGCIYRRGKVIFPRGQDRIQVGDSVMVVTTVKGFHDIRDILR